MEIIVLKGKNVIEDEKGFSDPSGPSETRHKQIQGSVLAQLKKFVLLPLIALLAYDWAVTDPIGPQDWDIRSGCICGLTGVP